MATSTSRRPGRAGATPESRTTKRLHNKIRKRIGRLTSAELHSIPPVDLLTRLRRGWVEYPFPDFPFAVTARTEFGWVYLSTGVGFLATGWSTTAGEWRRRQVLTDLALSQSMATETLGAYLELMFAHPSHQRLSSGLWPLIEEFTSPEEVRALRFLDALRGSGSVPMGEVLHGVGGLPR